MKGLNVNARDNNGWTALMVTAIYGRTEIAELLLKHGADASAKDNNGKTILLWAVGNHNPKVAELLLRHGAKE